MKTQKLPFWLLTIVLISTILLSSCTKETINEIEQTDSNLSAYSAYDAEAFKEMINRDLLFAQERIEKAKKFRVFVTKEKVLNQSLTASTGNKLYVPDDYATIQEAINTAADGDVVIVDGAAGIPFTECVQIINRNGLTIRGINNAIVKAGDCNPGWFDPFFVLYSNGITIENLTINSGSGWQRGILAVSSTDTKIVKNQFYGKLNDEGKSTFYGVLSLGCSNSLITKNKFIDNFQGIRLQNENDSDIVKNQINNATHIGAVILFSKNNRIEDLKVKNCGFEPEIEGDPGAGVVVVDCSDNVFENLESKENTNGLVVLSFGIEPCENNHFIRLVTKNNLIEEPNPGDPPALNQGIGISLENLGGEGVLRTLIADSESKNNDLCDLLDRGLYTNIVNSKIGSTCN